MEFDEYFSDSDAMFWNIEQDPTLRSTILSVMVLDGLPDTDEFDAMMMDMVEAVPRFRQRVVVDDYGIAPPRWEADPNLELSYHVRRVSVSGGGEMSDLLALAEPIQMQAFDKDRPLWELYLVDGLKDGRAALIMKIHHAISDGVGLVKMNAALVGKAKISETQHLSVDERRRRLAERTKAELSSKPDPVRGAIRHRVGTNRDGLRRVASGLGGLVSDMVRDPQGTIEITRDTLGSIGRLFGGGGEAASPVMTGRSMAINLNSVVVPLTEVKRVGKRLGGSVNDVFVTAVTGAMNRYHVQMGKPVGELRMVMPVNIRAEGEDGDKAGNQVATLRIMVPIDIADPGKRLHEIRIRTRAALGERAVKLFGEIMGITNRLPKGVTESMMSNMSKSSDFATSNVPGPRRPVESGGMRVDAMIPFGPPGGAAANLTLFSYAGNCHIGITSDRAAVTEPGVLRECLEKSFAELFSANGGPPS